MSTSSWNRVWPLSLCFSQDEKNGEGHMTEARENPVTIQPVQLKAMTTESTTPAAGPRAASPTPAPPSRLSRAFSLASTLSRAGKVDSERAPPGPRRRPTISSPTEFRKVGGVHEMQTTEIRPRSKSLGAAAALRTDTVERPRTADGILWPARISSRSTQETDTKHDPLPPLSLLRSFKDSPLPMFAPIEPTPSSALVAPEIPSERQPGGAPHSGVDIGDPRMSRSSLNVTTMYPANDTPLQLAGTDPVHVETAEETSNVTTETRSPQSANPDHFSLPLFDNRNSFSTLNLLSFFPSPTQAECNPTEESLDVQVTPSTKTKASDPFGSHLMPFPLGLPKGSPDALSNHATATLPIDRPRSISECPTLASTTTASSDSTDPLSESRPTSISLPPLKLLDMGDEGLGIDFAMAF